MQGISVVAIDLAKSVFQVHAVDARGKCLLRRKLSRREMAEFVGQLPVCTVAMEACGSANYWARKFQAAGHQVRLISPQFVKPFVKTNKNDASDAEAIAEAAMRPSMRFVPMKASWQLDIQFVHRVRERLVRQKKSIGNEMRSLLYENGIAVPLGWSKFHAAVSNVLSESESALSSTSRNTLALLAEELRSTCERIAVHEKLLRSFHGENENTKRLSKMVGVGYLSATALVAAVADPKFFRNGRHFSAWLGLVPRHVSSGGKAVMLGISKRGDKYLRSLLIEGARSALRVAKKRTDRLGRWAASKSEARGYNKAAVALANKHARIIWALLAKGEEYRAVA